MSWVEGYGVYLPETRLETAELMEFHGRSGKAGAKRMAVPDLDEDTITMGYEAAAGALRSAGLQGSQVQGLVWGSLSPPFALKSAATLLAKALGMPDDAMVVGLNSSPKLASEAIITAHGLLAAQACQRCLVVCSDFVPLWGEQALQLPSSAGAAALVMSGQGFARLVHWASHLGEAYDLWRLPGDEKPRYDQAAYVRAYLKSAAGALSALGAKAGFQAGDLSQLVLHAPASRLTAEIAKGLGLAELFAGSVAAEVGNLFSPSLLFGLAEAFEAGKAGDLIAAVSYGSGSSDALLWQLDRPAASLGDGRGRTARSLRDFVNIGVARHQQLSGCC